MKVTTISSNSAGVPKALERYEDFGATLTAGDFDADGRDDLAVGLTLGLCRANCMEDPNYKLLADGSVVVFRGSGSGLSGARAQVWSRSSPGVDGTSGGEQFGSSLAVGHLDAGPTDDLIVGAPFDRISGRTDAGSATVLLGSTSGLTTAGLGGTRFTQGTPGVAGSPEAHDYFGHSVHTIAVHNGAESLVILGAPLESIGKTAQSGMVHQLGFSKAGPTGNSSRAFHVGTSGVKGRVDDATWFGWNLG